MPSGHSLFVGSLLLCLSATATSAQQFDCTVYGLGNTTVDTKDGSWVEDSTTYKKTQVIKYDEVMEIKNLKIWIINKNTLRIQIFGRLQSDDGSLDQLTDSHDGICRIHR